MFQRFHRSLIHPEGWIFFSISALCSVFLSLMSSLLGVIGFILTAWCFYFFRNPIRVVPTRKGLIVSPADGLICSITQKADVPTELDLNQQTQWTRISIFLNIFDVHINRIPIEGEITHVHYHPGKFLNASLDKASQKNERQSLVVKVNEKISIPFIQIAGLIARRIRCDVSIEERVQTGQIFGLIRFGSRMDVYLPQGISPLVIVGQRAIGGETILADLELREEARQGLER